MLSELGLGFEDSIIKISSADGDTLGTGFFITGDGYLLTCYHVIEGYDIVSIAWKKAELPQHIKVHEPWCDKDRDFALLKASVRPGASVTPVLLSMDWKRGDEVFSAGYQYEALGFEAFPVSGRVTGVTERQGQILLTIENAVNVKRGISGAPALNGRTGRVIGMVAEKLEDTHTAFIVPVGEIIRKLRSHHEFDAIINRLAAEEGEGTPIFQAPPVPGYYIPQDDLYDIVMKLLDEDAGGQNLVISAIHGLGGIGKSTLAAAVAHEVRAFFPDGVLWVTLGQQPNILSLLNDWIRELGDYQFTAMSIQGGERHLRVLLAEKSALLVIDDAWNEEHVRPFLAGGAKCRALITTRDALIAKAAGAVLYSLDVFSAEQAIALVEKKLPSSLSPLKEADKKIALDVCEVVGFLPLAVELAAAQAADGVPWEVLRNDLSDEMLRFETLELPGAEEMEENARKRLSLWASFTLSVQRLQDDRRVCFAWLGATPDDAVITSEMAACFWEMDTRRARTLLRYLHDKALLISAGTARHGSPVYRMHDLLHDYAETLLTAPREASGRQLPGLGLTLRQTHVVLLGKYRKKTQNALWHTLPDDGYIFDHMAWHMEHAGMIEEYFALLSEETADGRNGWYEARGRLGQISGYIDDVYAAQRFAWDEYDTSGSGKALGRVCRCLLIISSIGSLSQNIPPMLTAELVKRGIWSSEQAFAIFLHNSNLGAQANTLIEIAPYLSPDLLRQGCQLIKRIKDKMELLKVMEQLAQHMTMPLLHSTSALVISLREGMGSYDARKADYVLAAIAESFAKLGLVDDAFETVRKIKTDTIKADALYAFYAKVSIGRIREALAEALQYKELSSSRDSNPKLVLLEALVCRLAELGFVEEALSEMRSIQLVGVRDDVTVYLAGQLAKQGRDRMAFELIKNMDYDFYIDDAMREAAEFFGPAVLSEAWGLVKGLPDDKFYTEKARIAVAICLPPDERDDIISGIHQKDMRNGTASRSMAKLAAFLSERQLEEAVGLWSHYMVNKRECLDRYMADMAQFLPEHLTRMGIETVLTVEMPPEKYLYGFERERVMKVLLARLAELGYVRDAARLAMESNSHDAAAFLVSFEDEEARKIIFDMIENIGNDRDKLEMVNRVARLVEVPEPLLASALDIAMKMDSKRAEKDEKEKDKSKEYVNFETGKLACSLTPRLLQKALDVTRHIGDDKSVRLAMAMLSRYLPQNMLDEAFSIIQAMDDDIEKQTPVAYYATRLAGLGQTGEAVRLLNESHPLGALDEIGSFVGLNSGHPLPRCIIEEVKKGMLTFKTPFSRIHHIASVVPHLDSSQREELLAHARKILNDDKYNRGLILALFVPYLQEPEYSEVLAEVRECLSANDRLDEMVLPQISAKLYERGALEKAFRVAYSIVNEQYRAETLLAIAPDSPETWGELLKIQIDWIRAKALTELYKHFNHTSAEDNALMLFDETLSTALGMINEEGSRMGDFMIQVELLIELLHFAPVSRKNEIITEAIASIGKVGHPNYEALYLARLLPHQSADRLGKTMEDIFHMAASQDFYLIEKIVNYLPEEERKRLLLKSLRMIDEDFHDQRYYAKLDPERFLLLEKEDMLACLADDGFIHKHKAEDLIGVISAIPAEMAVKACKGPLFAWLGSLERRELLEALTNSISPIMAQEGGEDAAAEIYHAVGDVGKWWP